MRAVVTSLTAKLLLLEKSLQLLALPGRSFPPRIGIKDISVELMFGDTGTGNIIRSPGLVPLAPETREEVGGGCRWPRVITVAPRVDEDCRVVNTRADGSG